MKKLMSSMLAIAAMASMISCTTENILDQETPGTDNNGLVPIKMTAEIGGLTTKALVPQESDGSLSGDVTDVHFLRWDATSADATVDWTAVTELKAAKILQAGTIEFIEKQYYLNDGNKTYLFGCHPIPTISNKKLQWTLDGKKDIIISDAQFGSKTTTTPLAFAFDHQLTLLKFNIKLPAQSSVTGEQLSSITVKNQNSTAIYDPTNSTFTFSDATTDMTTEGATVNTDITTAGIDGGYLLVDPSTAAGRPFDIVVATKVGANTKEYTGTITIEAQAKKAYDVKLTINQKQVEGTASVGRWESGGPAKEETIY